MIDNSSAFSSSEYDTSIKNTLPYYEDFYQQVVDVVRTYTSNSLTWLDVGSGTGKMAEVAMKELNIRNWTFCDSSAEMMDIVKKRFAIPNIEFLPMPAQNLDFHSKFDVVTEMQVNHYLLKQERIAVIQKCYEALKTGGLFFTFENFSPNSWIGIKLYLERWKSYQLNHGRTIQACEEHILRYHRNYFPISLSEHISVIESCGFRAAEVLWLSYMQVGLLGIK